MDTIITKTYEPTNSTHPVWRVKRYVQTRIYEFDVVDPLTGEILGKTKLHWIHDSDDEKVSSLYHGCSYQFHGYNPLPVTDRFHGVPLPQMLSWCKFHNLVLRDVTKRFINITYCDQQ